MATAIPSANQSMNAGSAISAGSNGPTSRENVASTATLYATLNANNPASGHSERVRAATSAHSGRNA